MSQSSNQITKPIEDNPQYGPRQGQQPSLYAQKHSKLDAHFGYSLSSLPGISLAGGLYPVVITIFFIVVMFISRGLPPGFGWGPVIQMMTLISFAFLLGAVIAIFVGFFAQVVVTAINWSLNYPFSALTVAGAGGGLTGFACTSWMFVDVSTAGMGLEPIWFLLVGPVTATIFGQWGAAWFLGNYVNAPTHKHQGRKYQFRISQLFALTAWVSILFAFDQLIPQGRIAIFAVIWLLLQSVLSYAAYFVRSKQKQERQIPNKNDATGQNDEL